MIDRIRAWFREGKHTPIVNVGRTEVSVAIDLDGERHVQTYSYKGVLDRLGPIYSHELSAEFVHGLARAGYLHIRLEQRGAYVPFKHIAAITERHYPHYVRDLSV